MGRRHSIHLAGFSHANPIPAACRLDRLVATGLINGIDPQTGRIAASFAGQCSFMLDHARAILSSAGGTMDDVITMTVWLKETALSGAFLDAWLAAFPDTESRPTCHTAFGTTAADILVQCTFLAALEDRPSARPAVGEPGRSTP